jgi:Na+/H+ antiporter NhaD/arsenite permease-like protein
VLLVFMIAGLAVSTLFDQDFVWFGGLTCLVAGFVAMLWLYRRDPKVAGLILKNYDWDTTFFLMGVFTLVFALTKTGVVDSAAQWVYGITGNSVLLAFILIIVFSLALSAFIDNVPYIAAMLPLVLRLSQHLGLSGNTVLAYGLLIGSCLGGNITPVGASANVVACGMLRRMGEDVSFWKFAKMGLPFTLAATAAASAFVWFVWM